MSYTNSSSQNHPEDFRRDFTDLDDQRAGVSKSSNSPINQYTARAATARPDLSSSPSSSSIESTPYGLTHSAKSTMSDLDLGQSGNQISFPLTENDEPFHRRLDLSRRSSIDTIESVFSNTFSISSISSVEALYDRAQRLSDFLSSQA
jgi:hypothetical protein